jgi:hypothetical protein
LKLRQGSSRVHGLVFEPPGVMKRVAGAGGGPPVEQSAVEVSSAAFAERLPALSKASTSNRYVRPQESPENVNELPRTFPGRAPPRYTP